MTIIINSFTNAWNLIFSFDKDLYGIIGLTLVVTVLSTVLSALLAIPAGVAVGSINFKGKKLLTRVIFTFMGLPPVVAGLTVYLLLSRKGPLGSFRLLFTPSAMVIAQLLIVIPVIAGMTIMVIQQKGEIIIETCKGLGFNRYKTCRLLLHESRYSVISAIMAGFGRAISEVGAVMLVGGNIQYHTRVITTAIVLETGKGNYDTAMALGLILLAISFSINWIVQSFQERV